jgi:hypothetical protein
LFLNDTLTGVTAQNATIDRKTVQYANKEVRACLTFRAQGEEFDVHYVIWAQDSSEQWLGITYIYGS